MFGAIPLLIVPFVLYNLGLLGIFGSGDDPWVSEILSIRMMSGGVFTMTLGDLMVLIALILLFNAIMFLLLEVPLVGYLVQPEATAVRGAAVSRWLNANGLRITGWLVGVFGASLLGQGIADLAR